MLLNFKTIYRRLSFKKMDFLKRNNIDFRPNPEKCVLNEKVVHKVLCLILKFHKNWL